MPCSSVIGFPFVSVCVMHQGVGSPSTVVQPVQVVPMKIKGKLHSASGSAPDMVEHVEVVVVDSDGALVLEVVVEVVVVVVVVVPVLVDAGGAETPEI